MPPSFAVCVEFLACNYLSLSHSYLHTEFFHILEQAAHLRSWPVASPKTGFQGELSQDVLLRGRLLQPTNPLALTNQAPATNTAISSQSSATLQQARILELLHCAQTTQTTQSRSVISQDVLPAQNQGQPLNGAALKRLFQAARIGTLK